MTASLAQLLGISASRIKVVSVHSNHRRYLRQVKEEEVKEEEAQNDQLLSLPSSEQPLYWSSSEIEVADAPHQHTLLSSLQLEPTLQTDDSVSLQFEILPATPTVALTVGASSTNSTASNLVTSNTFAQQNAMLTLGTKLLTLAVSGNMSETISRQTGLTTSAVVVVPPAVSVTLPPPPVVVQANLTAGATYAPSAAPSPMPTVSLTLGFQGLPASAFTTNGVPSATTITNLASAFTSALSSNGGSAFSVSVTTVIDALFSRTLYPTATGTYTTTTSAVRATFLVSTSNSATLTIATLAGGATTFATQFAATTGTNLNTLLSSTSLSAAVVASGYLASVTLTAVPSPIPTVTPTTAKPSATPSALPTVLPTPLPTTFAPTVPGQTWSPTVEPTTPFPTTFAPSVTPTTATPTTTAAPSVSFSPTAAPTVSPTLEPTPEPSTQRPTIITHIPTQEPTFRPSVLPGAPTLAPTVAVTVMIAVTQTVNGVDLATAQSASFASSFAATVAYTLGVSASAVSITSVNAVQRRLLAGVSVQYTVSTLNTPAVTLQTALTQAVSSGAFTTVLISNGYPSAQVSATPAVYNISPTAEPTSIPAPAASTATTSALATAGDPPCHVLAPYITPSPFLTCTTALATTGAPRTVIFTTILTTL